MPLDPEFIRDLDARCPADPGAGDRKRILENSLFVELSRARNPVGSAVWFTLDHHGNILCVREKHPTKAKK